MKCARSARELGLARGVAGPASVPRPGPGHPLPLLGVRRAACAPPEDGYVIPVHSVGVQGDERSYAPVLAIDSLDHARATDLINRLPGVNRVIAGIALSRAAWRSMQVCACSLTPERIERLRQRRRRRPPADPCQRITIAQVWQFPVILIPLGTAAAPDSVVLRPVDSVDGMTAQSVVMPVELREKICAELLEIQGIAGVFYDLTHKPPGTIEWE